VEELYFTNSSIKLKKDNDQYEFIILEGALVLIPHEKAWVEYENWLCEKLNARYSSYGDSIAIDRVISGYDSYGIPREFPCLVSTIIEESATYKYFEHRFIYRRHCHTLLDLLDKLSEPSIELEFD
jgi:hypothetical protein